MPIDFIAIFVTLPIVILTLTFVLFIRASSKPDTETEGAEESLDRWEKSRTVGYWISSVSLAIVYILVGMPKLSGLGDLMHRFTDWGYSEDFMLFIGASEFIAGIFLLIPKTSLYAATYLGLIMCGAIYTHLAFDSVAWALLPAFCLSFLVYIGYEDLQRGHAFGSPRVPSRSPA
jgi:uncharacterized membrane protein YphA (DoxX/SURF4 family)